MKGRRTSNKSEVLLPKGLKLKRNIDIYAISQAMLMNSKIYGYIHEIQLDLLIYQNLKLN